VAACSGSSSNGLVQWIGLDARPLAVGSQLPVNLAFATDGGFPAYAVVSSAPSVVSVQDQGHGVLLVSALDAGSAQLALTSDIGSASFSLVADDPASVTFSVLSHLAAQLDTALPHDGASGKPDFELVTNGTEVIQAVVANQAGESLNSWGLTQASAQSGLLAVWKTEPEQFTLTALADVGQTGGSVVLTAGLISGATAPVSFNVRIVDSAALVIMLPSPDRTVVLGEAFDSDNVTKVYGLGDWQFTCDPTSTCITSQLSLCAARLQLTTDGGVYTVTGTVPASPGSTQLLTRSVPLQ
jgi:hypothetical protein